MKTGTKRLLLFMIVIGSVTILTTAYLALSSPETINNGFAKLSRVFTDHTAPVWAVRFSPDGAFIASASVDSTVIIHEIKSGKIFRVLKQPEGITNIDFSPDGKTLVTASYDSKVRLWDIASGSISRTFADHNGTVWTVAYSPDGKSIASAGEDKTVVIRNIASGNILHTLQGHTLNIWAVKFNPAGDLLASGSFDNEIKIWDVVTGKLVKTISGHTEAVVDLAFSHNGKMLASTSDDKTIKIWDTGNWHLTKTLSVPEHVQAVAFSADDKRLLTGGKDKAMFGELIQNFTGQSERFRGVSARLWDIATGRIIQTFSSHKDDVNDVAYSKDNDWIATASADNSVELWHVER